MPLGAHKAAMMGVAGVGGAFGYSAGGQNAANSDVNTVDKIAFASDADATDVADLSVARRYCVGNQSSTNGYASGGYVSSPSDVIDKFSFATDSDFSDVGNLTSDRYGMFNASSSASGYQAGGDSGDLVDIIDKFAFASDGNATDVGDLLNFERFGAGHASSASGYGSAGLEKDTGAALNRIQKWSFSSDGDSTDVGDVTVARSHIMAGASSSASGYTAGGYREALDPSAPSNIIDKFPFASDGDSTDVGDLAVADFYSAGLSSADNGYKIGGQADLGEDGVNNYIEKWSFSSDGNASDIANLTATRQLLAGISNA
jgi:hypothetical protein